jgi:GT2 family glycosyltransferase
MATGVNEQEGLEKPQDMLEKYVEYDENETDRQHPDFSCFMINKRTIDRIGWFDENFVIAYFEDSDFHARIALAGEKAISTTSAIYYHFCSKTVAENDYLKPIVKETFIGNKAYFIEKWGTENVGDVPKMLEVYYKTPFNNPDKDIKNVERDFSL